MVEKQLPGLGPLSGVGKRNTDGGVLRSQAEEPSPAPCPRALASAVPRALVCAVPRAWSVPSPGQWVFNVKLLLGLFNAIFTLLIYWEQCP